MSGASVVEVGQTWQTLANTQTTLSVVVEAIEGAVVQVRTLKDRRFTIPLRHFLRGQRGCRLLVHADGRPAEAKKPLNVIGPNLTEQSTASDTVKTHAPRGLAKASDVDQAILDRFEAGGETIEALAKSYGVTKSTIHGRLSRARAAIFDARQMRALRSGSGSR